MRLSRRTNAIILWIISIGLLVGMIITFTPTLGNFFGSRGAATNSAPVLNVNDETIEEVELVRARQNPLYSAVTEGEVGEDLELLLLDSLVQQELLEQAAADTRVTRSEAREAVNDFREQQNVAGRRNDEAYLRLIGRAGFDDASFRDYMREQVRLEKYQESITGGAEVSDDEVMAFYEANQEAYQTEARIRARQIVVDDEALANELLEQAQAGQDFAALARENSSERADRDGALGAAEGSTEPQPIGRAALPGPVANAAFALEGEGLSEVIENAGNFYLISVEEYIPAGARPFDEVEADVREDALEAKQAAAIEAELERLRAAATISTPEGSSYSYDNPVVAQVGDEEITRSELAAATYANPSIQQALTPDTAQLITSFFKPNVLNQLIDQKLAYLGAAELGQTFIGSEALIAQSALEHVSRDATVTEEEVQDYYDANLSTFTDPASAEVTQVTFESQETASDFREQLLGGGEAQALAEDLGGTLEDLGSVTPGMLGPELDGALFETDAFSALPDGEAELSDILVITETVEVAPEDTSEDGATTENEDASSATEEADAATDEGAADETAEEAADPETADDVVEDLLSTEDEAAESTADVSEADVSESDDAAADETIVDEAATDDAATEVTEAQTEVLERFVVLIAERTPERVRPLEEVRAQVEEAVLQGNRQELRAAWLEGLREDIPVENLLTQAEDDAAAFEVAPAEGAEGETDPAGEETTTEDATATEGEGAAEEESSATEEATTDEAEGAADAAEETTDEAASEDADAEEDVEGN